MKTRKLETFKSKRGQKLPHSLYRASTNCAAAEWGGRGEEVPSQDNRFQLSRSKVRGFIVHGLKRRIFLCQGTSIGN